MTTPDLTAARTAASVDNIAALAGMLPQAVALDPARLPLAKGWLLGLYLPAWVAEAGIILQGRDLGEVEADAQRAWSAHRAAARAQVDPAAWPSLCDRVRDVARETMQGSLEAAIRLPIEDAAHAALEQRVWAVVETCIWPVAWRTVERAPGVPVEQSIPLALVPRRVELQRSAASIVLGATPPAPKVVPPPHVEDGILFNADAAVLAFMREHLSRVKDWGPCSTLGVLRDGALIGGLVFNNYHPEMGDIEISAAFTTGAWFRPRTLRRVFAFPFDDLGCRRLTDHVPRKLKAARRFAEKAGFKLEGVKRGGFDGRQDLILYGMTRAECRFLKGA